MTVLPFAGDIPMTAMFASIPDNKSKISIPLIVNCLPNSPLHAFLNGYTFCMAFLNINVCLFVRKFYYKHDFGDQN